jgi:hypothetical protein
LIRFIPGPHSGFVRNPWRQRLIIGWGGMRGAISLAIALTLPLEAGGGPRTGGLRQELVRVQRAKLDELYRNRKISDEIRRSIALTLDLQDGPRGGLPPV